MQRRTIILIIATAFVLTAGITMLALWPEKDTEPTPVPSPNIRNADTLIQVSYKEVDSIIMLPRNEPHFTLQLDHSEPEFTDIHLIAEDALFPGMQPVMLTIFSYATSMMYLTRIAEDADDEQLILFGFDAPVLNWRVNLLNGTSMEFAIGLRLAEGTGYYVRNIDSRDVYLLGNEAVSFLLMSIEDIYDLFFFPYPPSGDEYETWDLIEYLLLERPWDETIEFRRREDEEWFESPLGVSRYYMLQPILSECSDSILKSVLLEPVTNIIPEQVVSVRPPDLSVYGLDSPARLTISTSGWEGTLLIGNPGSEHRGWYVMIEGHDAVLLDPHGNYSFLGVNPAQLKSQMTWVHHIETVSSVVFELGEVTRTLRIDHPVSGSDDTIKGWLDDKEISDRNTRRLYASAMSILSSGDTDEPVPGSGPDYRLTMVFTNGRSQALELYNINDSQYLMVLDNQNLGVYTTRLQIQIHLLSRFEALDAGEDLQAR